MLAAAVCLTYRVVVEDRVRGGAAHEQVVVDEQNPQDVGQARQGQRQKEVHVQPNPKLVP